VYGGIGFDWQLNGSSDMAVSLDGDTVGIVRAQNGQEMMAHVGRAQIVATENASPSAGRLRALLGAQTNLAFVKLFLQVNFATQDPLVASLAFGARVAF
jgi:hypothetical protein